MRLARVRALALVLISVPLSASFVAAQPASRAATIDMTPVNPESVGFSSERLERLHALMEQAVKDQQVAGVVTILARHGKVVGYRAYGMRDIASHTAMTKDTIFRDYSMTKPVTAVAMMMLYEQGKWLPSDPISKYIPEFAHLKVYAGTGADGKPILEDPVHPPTMGELMTHTADSRTASSEPLRWTRWCATRISSNRKTCTSSSPSSPQSRCSTSPARNGSIPFRWISRATSSKSFPAKRCPSSIAMRSSCPWA
jgi:CubicO group peptidase (beta-lactamase class C family)